MQNISPKLYETYFPKSNVPQAPILLSLPHSGTYIPNDIAENMNQQLAQKTPDTDWHLEKLYDFAPSLGITTIKANYNRYVIDLNRDPNNTPLYNDGRVCSSLVPTHSFDLKDIYREQTPSIEEVSLRREKFFDPYYKKTTDLLNQLKKDHTDVLFFDGHSIKRQVSSIQIDNFPDLILGNQDGTTASAKLIDTAIQALSSGPFQLTHNTPFKGGNLTRHFGCPEKNIHSLQLEMSQDLYMNEENTEYLPEKAKKVKTLLSHFFQKMIQTLLSKDKNV